MARLPLTHAPRPTLLIGAADDALEREADAVADEVMHSPDPGLSMAPAPAMLSRKCPACEAEEKKLQMKPAVAAQAAGVAPPIVREALRSPGRPLDATTRAFFEPRFGCDLGQVRVHAGAKAAESARRVSALAYTIGREIVFGVSRYTPSTSDGRRLIAHELAHVIQQGEAGCYSLDTASGQSLLANQLAHVIPQKALQRSNARVSPTIQRQDDTQAIGPGNAQAVDSANPQLQLAAMVSAEPLESLVPVPRHPAAMTIVKSSTMLKAGSMQSHS